MKKFTLIFMLFTLEPLFAAQVPGDINFSLDSSFEQHAYKFRLIINGKAITYPTACIPPGNRVVPTLTYGSIGLANAKLTIQASDCTYAQDQWVTLNDLLDYDNDYWYDLSINMLENSFHL